MNLERFCFSALFAALMTIAGSPFPSAAADGSAQTGEATIEAAPQPADDPRWGVLTDIGGTRWALEGRGEHYIVSFNWADDGEVLVEEWRGAGTLLPVRRYVTRMQWDEQRETIRARGTEGTKARWAGQVSADGTVEFRGTSFFARGHVYRFIWQDDTLAYVEGGESGLVEAPFKTMPMTRLDEDTEARYVAAVNQAQALVLRQRRERDLERSDQWSRTMGMIDSALDASLAVVHEQQAQTRAQNADISHGASSDIPAWSAQNPSSSASGTPAEGPSPVAAVDADSGGQVREAYVVCEVVAHGNFDGNNGALFFSEVQPIRLVDNRVQGDPQGTFLAKVSAAYGVSGTPICETLSSAGAAGPILANWMDAYPSFKHVMTGMAPLN